MRQLTPAALLVLQRQRNLISVSQLREAGISRGVRQRLLEEGVLEYVGQSVLAVPGGPLTLERRSIALCLRHPCGFITGPTGGSLLGLRRMPHVAMLHFSVLHGSKVVVPPGVQLRQTTRLPDHHRRRLDNGLVVANWARLAFDLAADLPRRHLASVVDQMIHQGHTDVAELAGVARLLCAPGRPGSRPFAAMLLERGGRQATESDPEHLILDGLLQRGVPVVPQVRKLALPNGGDVRIDMAVEEVRWGVEVDIHPSHIELPGTTRDKQRDRQLHLIDWQVEHVTPIDLMDLDGTLAELTDLYRARVAVVRAR